MFCEAGEWFAGWFSKSKRAWNNLKHVCANFADVLNFGHLLHEAVNYNSNGCTTFGHYARLKLPKLEALNLNFNPEQLISSACFGLNDNTVQNQALQMSHL